MSDVHTRFETLLEQHGGIVGKVVRIYARTADDRRDLAQEIATQLWRAYSRYDDRLGAFSTWMYRIALNVAISFLRRHSHPVRQTLSLDENEMEVVDETAGRTEPDERIPLLQQVIASLAPLDRGLMLLYLDDHSYREIAAILGITETNVATKLNRLKQRVRGAIIKLSQQTS
jgi:RNA polymerase sigma-70 factor, ECF subfamily